MPVGRHFSCPSGGPIRNGMVSLLVPSTPQATSAPRTREVALVLLEVRRVPRPGSALPTGVVVTVGGPDVRLNRLLEAAAPGQVVMSAAAREACAGAVEAAPLRDGPEGTHDVFLLSGLPPPTGA